MSPKVAKAVTCVRSRSMDDLNPLRSGWRTDQGWKGLTAQERSNRAERGHASSFCPPQESRSFDNDRPA
jgi:hypothetical protein